MAHGTAFFFKKDVLIQRLEALKTNPVRKK